MHRVGGAGLAYFAVSGLLQEGPCSNREGGRPTGRMNPQKHSAGCLRGASKFNDRTGSLWDFAWGWEREMALAGAFVPRQAELCFLGLNNSPSWCPLALPLSEQSC